MNLIRANEGPVDNNKTITPWTRPGSRSSHSGDRYRAGANEESDERPRSRRKGESGRRLRQDCATAGDKMPGARRVHRVLFYSGGSTRSTEDSDVAVRHQHAVGTCADHDRGMVHRSSRDGVTLERLACKDALAGRARRPAGETDGPARPLRAACLDPARTHRASLRRPRPPLRP